MHRTGSSLEKLLNRVISRVMRRLIKDGLLFSDQEYQWLDFQETDTLDTLNAPPIRYRAALGLNTGGRTLSLKNPSLQHPNTQPKTFTVDRDAFSLNAAVACQPHQRQRLERLCRYVTDQLVSFRLALSSSAEPDPKRTPALDTKASVEFR